MEGGQHPLEIMVLKFAYFQLSFRSTSSKIKVGRCCVQCSDLMSDHNGQPKVRHFHLPLAFTTELLELRLQSVIDRLYLRYGQVKSS